MKLLIIDDDPEFRLLISHRLRAKTVTAIAAADVIQAIRLVREQRPDIIMLDIELPGGDGFLILERLKGNRLFSTIPVIIVTARDPAQVEEKALHGGAAAVLHKPVDCEGLMTIMEQVLTHSAPPNNPPNTAAASS